MFIRSATLIREILWNSMFCVCTNTKRCTFLCATYFKINYSGKIICSQYVHFGNSNFLNYICTDTERQNELLLCTIILEYTGDKYHDKYHNIAYNCIIFVTA